ncbi:MAG TPA: hypothetical protein EYG93_01790 [Sulfurospirillum arcachonense]|nr:hypothetical protein [Sulfurospirillum arcachonense]
MQTIHLEVDDSLVDKLMKFVNELPKNKILIKRDEYPSITFEKAQKKVNNAVNNISKMNGTPLNQAIKEILEN